MRRDYYSDLDGINWSRLKLLRVSPYHYRYSPPRGETPALLVGLAAHTLVLEPDRFDDEYAVWSGQRRGNAWKEFKATNDHRHVLSQAEYDRARACADAVLSDPIAFETMRGGVSEKAIVWEDEVTGRLCKGRPDHANGRLVDMKTTAVIEERRFSALAARMGYHGQLAFYEDGLIANGHSFEDVPALVVVQSEKPHDVIVYDVDVSAMEAGRREYRRLLDLLVACEEADDWPGIARGETRRLVLPEWAYADPEDDNIELTMGGSPMTF